MTRFIVLFLIISLCLSLIGCAPTENGDVAFYYSRKTDQFQYFDKDGVIRCEFRDLAGHRNDLRYMVGLYLAGPLDEGLTHPFPRATHLLSVNQENNHVSIELSGHSSILTDSAFTLGCACLTLTCLEFTGCQQVTVTSADRTITMDAEQILLFDAMPQHENTGG